MEVIELGDFVVEKSTLMLDMLERIGKGGKTPIEGEERGSRLVSSRQGLRYDKGGKVSRELDRSSSCRFVTYRSNS